MQSLRLTHKPKLQKSMSLPTLSVERKRKPRQLTKAIPNKGFCSSLIVAINNEINNNLKRECFKIPLLGIANPIRKIKQYKKAMSFKQGEHTLLFINTGDVPFLFL